MNDDGFNNEYFEIRTIEPAETYDGNSLIWICYDIECGTEQLPAVLLEGATKISKEIMRLIICGIHNDDMSIGFDGLFANNFGKKIVLVEASPMTMSYNPEDGTGRIDWHGSVVFEEMKKDE